MPKPVLLVDWATHDAAKYAVEHWHYSRSLPAGKAVRVGAWEDGRFIGVVIFGRGAASEIGSPYGLPQDQICELVRVALRSHITPVSRILSLSLRLLKKANPGIRLVVSFADTEQGHHGGIYQATGWVYEGAKEYHLYRVHGTLVHPKTLHSKYGMGGQSVAWLRRHVDANAERVHGREKHKYLMPVDDEMRARILPLAKPYPKRVKQAMAGPPVQRQGSTDPHAPDGRQFAGGIEGSNDGQTRNQAGANGAAQAARQPAQGTDADRCARGHRHTVGRAAVDG